MEGLIWETATNNCSTVIAQLSRVLSLSCLLQASVCHCAAIAWQGFFCLFLLRGLFVRVAVA